MEDEAQNTNPAPEPRNDVGFPEPKKEKKSSKLPIIIIIVVILLGLVGGGIYFLTKPNTIADEEMVEENNGTMEEVTETPIPTQEEIDRSGISIQVLNGTTISGLAGDLKTQLEKLGYSDIETANASKKDYETTEVKFASSIATAIKDEIVAELNKAYEEVKTVSGSPSGSDIQITVGFPKGHTVTPTTKATSTATPTPTGSTTSTTTPTTTSTVTPTP